MRSVRRSAGLFGAAIGIAVALASCSGRAAVDAPPSATQTFVEGPFTAFVGVRVFDGESVMANATVLVAGEEIVAVGRDIVLPAEATIVDGANRTLLPGLIDSHVHVWERAHLETAVVFGVTTMADMMTPAAAASRFRSEQAGDAGFTRSDIISAGYAATAPGGHGTEYGMPVPTLSTPAEAEAFVAERVAEGSDYIKIIHDDGTLYGVSAQPTLDAATVGALVDAAHAHGRIAVVHPGGLSGARIAQRAGADALVHIWGDSVPPAAFIDRMREDSMFVVPTLGVQASVTGTAAGAGLVGDTRLAPFLDQDARTSLARSFPTLPATRASYPAAAVSTALLRERSVPVLVGTDAPNPGTWYGVSVHDEMSRMVRDAGFSPMEALRAATSVPAREFDLRDRGRIDIGMRADLVLVEGDPTTDIDATRAIVGVWKRGRALDREAARARVAARLETAARVSRAAEIPAEGLLLSDFADGTPSASMGRWMVSTDQLAGGTSTGAMEVRDGALVVAGTVQPGPQFAWSGVMLFPAPQPMQPIDLSGASGFAFRARGPGSFAVALFTVRGGRIPAVQQFQTTSAWSSHEFAWSDFGEHDGSDVQGIAILAGPQPGTFEFAIDEVKLQGR